MRDVWMVLWLLMPLVAALAACDTSPVVTELQYGIVTIDASEPEPEEDPGPGAPQQIPGELEIDAVGFFYRAERAPLPESRSPSLECTTGPIPPVIFPTPGFTAISAGESVEIRHGPLTMSLLPVPQPAFVRYERQEDEPLPVQAGATVQITVPGEAGGFSPASATIPVMALPEFQEIGVPAGNEPVVVSWTPAADQTSAISIVLRYGTATATPNEQLVCLVPDNGSFTIPGALLEGWRTAVAGSRSAAGRRWRSEFVQSGADLLAVYSQAEQSIAVMQSEGEAIPAWGRAPGMN